VSDKKITGAIEFISTRGERGGIDDQINHWVKTNPEATIIDVKYRVAVYQDDGKNKLAKLALLLYHQAQGADPPQPQAKAKAEPPKIESKKSGPGANTMIMSLRKEKFSDQNE